MAERVTSNILADYHLEVESSISGPGSTCSEKGKMCLVEWEIYPHDSNKEFWNSQKVTQYDKKHWKTTEEYNGQNISIATKMSIAIRIV